MTPGASWQLAHYWAGFPVPNHAAGRGRPPQAAARRAGLEVVENLLTSKASKGLSMRDAYIRQWSVSPRVGILGKQGKVILEGPREALQDCASFLSGCLGGAANHTGLGVAAHACHQ